MKLFLAALIFILLCIAGVGTYIYLGMYDIAADMPHTEPVYEVLEILRERSIAKRSVGVEVPPLDNPALIAEGARHYTAMCSGCHLAPGMEETELRSGLYPQPPNLAHHEHGEEHASMDMQSMAARQFWIIKHGIKLTGMPAWGATHSDEAIWGLVAFLQKLPTLSAQDYKAISTSAGNHQHDHGGHHEQQTEHEALGAGHITDHEAVSATPAPTPDDKVQSDQHREHGGEAPGDDYY